MSAGSKSQPHGAQDRLREAISLELEEIAMSPAAPRHDTGKVRTENPRIEDFVHRLDKVGGRVYDFCEVVLGGELAVP